jgi:hypothetical protein
VAGYYGFQGEKAIITRNPTAWGAVEGEIFRAGVLGASRGFADGFQGGKGNFKTMLNETLTAAVSAALTNGVFAYVRLAALKGDGIGYPNGIPTGTPALKDTINLNIGVDNKFQTEVGPNLAAKHTQNITWPDSQNTAVLNLSSQNFFSHTGFGPNQINNLKE